MSPFYNLPSPLPAWKGNTGPTIGNIPDMKRKIKKANQDIPRYLFRSWHEFSGGEHDTLNSTKAIIPRAFNHKSRGGHTSILDMPRDYFVHNTINHVGNNRNSNFYTEFSSWSSSLGFVLNFNNRFTGHRNIHIAMVDTEMLVNTNCILHVPALIDIIDEGTRYSDYDYEYLVHGVINKGEGYKAVALDRLERRNLYVHYPVLGSLHASVSIGKGLQIPQSPSQHQNLGEEVSDYKRMAKLYGPKFETAFFVAVYLIKNRNFPEEIDDLCDFVAENFELPDWSGSRGVLCASSFPPAFQDNAQMLVLMDALQRKFHGRGARGRVQQYEARRLAEASRGVKEGTVDSNHDSVMDGA